MKLLSSSHWVVVVEEKHGSRMVLAMIYIDWRVRSEEQEMVQLRHPH